MSIQSTLSLLFIVIVGIVAHSEYLPHLLAMVDHPRTQRDRSRALRDEADFFKNVNRVTNGGTNAEAYWFFDNSGFSFQAIRAPHNLTHPCDLIYVMDRDGSNVRLISEAKGRTTCSYGYPNNVDVVYSSTKEGSPYCPPPVDLSAGYLWPINKDMSIYRHNLKTGHEVQLRPGNDAYEAESTISPDGKRIVFTTAIDGDLELYTMNLDGSDPRRLTYTAGYDGGAFFSFNSKMITWRANRPKGAALRTYLDLISLGLVAPVDMQVYYMFVDGPAQMYPIQVTNNTGVNFAPFFLPNDEGLIFASNVNHPAEFHLYTVDLDGSNVQRVTFDGTFNSFPMFSFDKKQIVWCSNRDAKVQGQIDVFTADWVGPGSLERSNVRKLT